MFKFKIILIIFLVTIPSISFCMKKAENDEMTVIRRFEEAKPFEGKFVAYQPRTMLGEHYGYQLNPYNFLNYGYIEERYLFKDEVADVVQPYLYLLTLSNWLDSSPTYRISDDTLSREQLLLRLAKIHEIKKIKEVMQESKAQIEFHYIAGEATDTCRFLRRNYGNVAEKLDEQIELLKSNQSEEQS